jgi:hypothetical protein
VSGALNGGTPTGGGAPTGGAETGGTLQDPSCPAEPPVDGESCGDVDLACFYKDCSGEGLTRAGCLDSVWHVRTTPCCPETRPIKGEACPGDDYYCDDTADCPGGEVSLAYCDAGVWGVGTRPCCPEEPPGVDPVVCGPDVSRSGDPNTIQYSCAWQDCTSYGVADGPCDAYGTLTSYALPCERFFCGNGNTGPNRYCEASQICADYRLPVYVPGGGRVYRCADNPCAPGALEVGCLRESVCPTAWGAYRTPDGGIGVVCLL